MIHDTEHCEEIQHLVWLMLDERISERQTRRLEQLLEESDEARKIYTLCVQMHSDLHHMFKHKKPDISSLPASGAFPLPLVDTTQSIFSSSPVLEEIPLV